MVFEGSKRKKWVIYLTLWWMIYLFYIFSSFTFLLFFFVTFHNFFINYFKTLIVVQNLTEWDSSERCLFLQKENEGYTHFIFLKNNWSRINLVSNLKEIWKWKIFTYYDRFISVNDSLFWCDQYIFLDLFSFFQQLIK